MTLLILPKPKCNLRIYEASGSASYWSICPWFRVLDFVERFRYVFTRSQTDAYRGAIGTHLSLVRCSWCISALYTSADLQLSGIWSLLQLHILLTVTSLVLTEVVLAGKEKGTRAQGGAGMLWKLRKGSSFTYLLSVLPSAEYISWAVLIT